MNARSYIRSSLAQIAVMAVATLLAFFMLRVGGAGEALALLVAGVVLASWVLAFAIDYSRKRAFFRDLEQSAEDASFALRATEVLECPDCIEGRVAFDSLRAISKAANDEIAASRRQLQEYREYIETWVHETKSPLAAAHLMVENMEEELSAAHEEQPDPEVLLARVEALDDELDRTEGYIEQALFYARSEVLDRDYLIRSYSLHGLVSTAVKANARLLITARVVPVLNGLDLNVFTDEKWLVFILGQVIQNSVKYAREDGARIAFRGRLVDEGLSSERVELTVRDNGCGVSAADLPRVFDKGFTGDVGRTGKRSTGIGLYLVKRLCDKMGIEVGAESVQGEGFTVTFGFPTNKFHYFED